MGYSPQLHSERLGVIFMKKSVLCVMLLVIFAVTAAPSFAISDAEYKKLLKESEDFRSADEELNGAWAEAKKMLPADDFKKLQKEQSEWIKKGRGAEAKEMIDAGTPKDEAYYEVTMERIRYINGFIGYAELKKKPYKGHQGLYSYSDISKDGRGATGEMSVWWYDENDPTHYVSFQNCFFTSKENANTGEFAGKGQLEGNTLIIIGEHDDALKVKIVFDGDKAAVTTDDTFKQSGELGHGVVLDGVYTRK